MSNIKCQSPDYRHYGIDRYGYSIMLTANNMRTALHCMQSYFFINFRGMLVKSNTVSKSTKY